MQVRKKIYLILGFLGLFLTISNQDIVEDKLLSACNEEQEANCFPGQCKPSPRDYPESYTCECTRNTFLHRSFLPWRNQPIEVRCEPLLDNPCLKCHEKNTIKCTQTSNSTSICNCYPEYSESSNCYEKKNACEAVPIGATLAGKEACRVEYGNLCVPQLGTQKYTCICVTPFRASRDLGFPNCMGDQETPCDRQLCVGFQPLKSVDIRLTPRGIESFERAKCVGNGTCICPKNWHGEHCTNWYATPKDFSWSSWTSCKPECLDRSAISLYSDATGIGYKMSKSICDAEDPNFCGGNLKKWGRCKITNLCSDDKDEDTENFPPEVARVSANVLKDFYDKVRNSSKYKFTNNN